MRLLYTLLTFCLMTALAGCGSDDTSPTYPDPPEPEPVAEAGIGVSGGALTWSGFDLTVPAGAFADSADLKLYSGSGADFPDFPDGRLTGAFLLSGLPAQVAAPLTLTLYTFEASTGDPLIAVGAVATDRDGTERVVYDYLEAAATDTALTVSWQPDAGAKSMDAYNYFFGPREARVRLLPPSDPRFRIVYPPEGEDHIETVALNLINAYLTYDETWNLDLTYAGTTIDYCPILVDFSHNDPPADDYVPWVRLGGPDDTPRGHLSLYRDHLGPDTLEPMLVSAAAHLGRMVLWGQIPRDEFYTEVFNRHIWLSEAVTLWAEDWFSTDETYVPPLFDAAGLDLEYGLINGIGDYADRIAFGRAASALLKFLVEDEADGAALLTRTCAALRAGQPVDAAFLNSIQGTSDDWWCDFLATFVAGDLFDAPASVFLDQSLDRTMDETDWEAVYTNFYTDLSAHIYRLDPAYADWDEGAYLDIEVLTDDVNPDYVEALVYVLDDGELSLLGRGREVSVSGLKGLHDDGADLLVVVANAAWSLEEKAAAEIALSLEVGTNDLSNYTRAELYSHFEVNHIGEGWVNSGVGLYSATSQEGVWDGNTLTVDLAYTGDLTTDTGELVITFDPTTGDVVSFHGNTHHTQSDVNLISDRQISGGAIPRTEVGDGWLIFRLTGTAVCTCIEDASGSRTIEGALDYQWTDIRCHDGEPWESDIYIRLDDPSK